MKKLMVILAFSIVLGCGYEQKAIDAVRNEWTDSHHKETWGQWADRNGATWKAWEAKALGQKIMIVNIEKTKAGKEVVIQFMYNPKVEGDVVLGAFKIWEKGKWIGEERTDLPEIERFLSTGVTPEEQERKRKLAYEECLKKAYSTIIGKKFVAGPTQNCPLFSQPVLEKKSDWQVEDAKESTEFTIIGFLRNDGINWGKVKTSSGKVFYVYDDTLRLFMDLDLAGMQAKCK